MLVALSNAGKPDDVTWEGFAARLGPVSLSFVRGPEAGDLIRERVLDGHEAEDAVLAAIFERSPEDRALAGEFLGYFLDEMLQMGFGARSEGLRRHVDPEDLVQSMFGDLWPELFSLEFHSRAQFLSFLLRRLRWKTSDRKRRLLRKRRREDLRIEADPADLAGSTGSPSPATEVALQDEARALALAISRLPERDRALLRSYLRGESPEEMARSHGIGIQAARKALQRAIQRLRSSL